MDCGLPFGNEKESKDGGGKEGFKLLWLPGSGELRLIELLIEDSLILGLVWCPETMGDVYGLLSTVVKAIPILS